MAPRVSRQVQKQRAHSKGFKSESGACSAWHAARGFTMTQVELRSVNPGARKGKGRRRYPSLPLAAAGLAFFPALARDSVVPVSRRGSGR